MSIEQITSTAEWVEQKTGTKSGSLVVIMVILVVFFSAAIWFIYGQLQTVKEEKTDALKQVTLFTEREARIKDECAEMMRKYFEMFKDMGAQFAGNVNMFQSVERKTDAAIRQQNSIINKSRNDEEN